VRSSLAPLALATIVFVASAAAEQAGAPAGAAGMRVYRDPATGKLGSPPPGAVAPPPEQGEENEEPLVEEPSPTPGGGVSVDLKGRFKSTTGVTSDPRPSAGTQGSGQK